MEYLSPIDQLFELNKELIPSLEKFEYPIIVVGGQALYYWVDYYYSLYADIPPLEQITSIDIDYAARLKDARYLPEIWNVNYEEAKNLIPPSLAKLKLSNSNNEIKRKDSCLFIDIDEYLRNDQLKANIVDIIDLPIGFAYNDFTDSKKTGLYTECFEYPKEWQCPPNPKLRILNPISCLKSRLSNISAKIKDIRIEKERVKAIKVPIYAFLEQKFRTNEFRKAKKYMDYFLDVIESDNGLKMETLHGIELLKAVKNLKDNILDKLTNIPEKYLSKDLQSRISRIDEKISKKLRLISQ